MQRKRILELLSQVLIDRLTALEDGSSIFKALNLLHDEADSINFILFTAIDGDDALSVFFLFIWEYFDHGSSWSLNDISDHIAL